jgi:hypothetical protein
MIKTQTEKSHLDFVIKINNSALPQPVKLNLRKVASVIQRIINSFPKM